jgi:hypothetical protein
LAPKADIPRQDDNVRYVPILLKKSFGGGERNFLEPLMRFVRNDVRDRFVSQKNDHGLSPWRYAHPSGGLVQKSTFARFLEFSIFDFFNSICHEATYRYRRE